MSAAISPSTHRPYGVQRVCRVWAMPRSTFYRASRPADCAPARPRGLAGAALAGRRTW